MVGRRAPREVERVPVEDRRLPDDVRRERRHDVQLAVLHEAVVRRVCRHLEFAVPNQRECGKK